MKKILLITLTLSLIACKEGPKNYATLSGKITNKNSDSLVIRSRTYSKTIKVNDDGSFSDTLKVEAGIFNLFDGVESTYLFLKDGVALNLTLDTEAFDETIRYTGKGAETSNYIAKKTLIQEKELKPDLLKLEEEAFKTKVADIHKSFTELFESSKNMDSAFAAREKQGFDKMQEGLLKMYQRQKAMATQYDDFKGKPSPDFVNYENYKGGTTSLSDLKGKYVYVDVWATWCGPCKREIPFLKEVEAKYHNKNIEFVSISVDEGRGFKGDTPEEKLAAAKAGWKKMIAEKDMGGIQLFSDKAWKSDFVQGYKITGIPRFILIDPDGNVVDANAPRPSSPKLVELFDDLNI
ncbi:TlpA family protein disulfide reductase [Seonamhaeicola aphaedonensis]|uniref:Thiol-disulfide isomerase/thioredoxin n=1 Tax=Seonamhaeicola aphaedonensis TaxID=1461338 RepID=A0A3D9HIS8_9FLAO|nr:TlpA disulfide reductase family protein [Seonamhaeicola aphaedonensis]RED49344.1 thiol-disulfide isomerase/thioredoxin [Seonamhaeicola aphaedonensis]